MVGIILLLLSAQREAEASREVKCTKSIKLLIERRFKPGPVLSYISSLMKK